MASHKFSKVKGVVEEKWENTEGSGIKKKSKSI